MQNYKISFKGQKIYIGIDVHKKNWQVAVITESGLVKRLSIKANAKELFDFLKKHYPDGEYMAVYESGFSGFSTYYALTELGVNCIVIHAADVPTTQYEESMKTDRIDAEKLARSLKAGLLRAIYVRPKENIDDRSVVRIRRTIQKQLGGSKARVKHLLPNHLLHYYKHYNLAINAFTSSSFVAQLVQNLTALCSASPASQKEKENSFSNSLSFSFGKIGNC